MIAAAYLTGASRLVMTEQNQAALTQVFHDVFDDDSIVLRPDLTASDVDGWDSLAHVRLLLTVERKFGIKFNAVEAGKLKNVGELIELIESKLSAPARK
jgi:acyl carrier protein